MILAGIVAEYRLSVGTGWHERLRVGNDKRINCDGREGDGDELAYATSRVFSSVYKICRLIPGRSALRFCFFVREH